MMNTGFSSPLGTRRLVYFALFPLLFAIAARSLFRYANRRLFLPSASIPESLAASMRAQQRQHWESQMQSRDRSILSAEQVAEYRDRGFVVLKNFMSEAMLEAMRGVVTHTIASPSGLVRNANSTKFCGFSLHNHLFIPEWRDFAYRLSLGKVAAELMDAKKALYSMDIFHATTHHCGNESVGQSHSDHNQSPFSIEKKKNYGDNMVVAWIALDELKDITMDLFPGSHQAFDEETGAEVWSEPAYCEWWKKADAASRFSYLNGNSQRINLKPGDVALFQGLTFHQVRKSAKCKLDTCRRITIRYVDGATTRWRDDIDQRSVWPIVQRIGGIPGEIAAARLAAVYDASEPDIDAGPVLSPLEGRPLLPAFSDWLPILRQMVFGGGIQAHHIINQCPHRR